MYHILFQSGDALVVPRTKQLTVLNSHMRSFRISKVKLAGLIVLACVAILAVYVLSVVWRVSIAEQRYFGCSRLIPLSWSKQKLDEPPTPESYSSGTTRFVRDGRTVVVYKQLVNSFQHAYGSALACYEIGRVPADYLFRCNEYAEFIFGSQRAVPDSWLDTKKDLANNATGRQIGATARKLKLHGTAADLFMQRESLKALEDGRVIDHFRDPRVQSLPEPNTSCPGLQILAGRGSEQ